MFYSVRFFILFLPLLQLNQFEAELPAHIGLPLAYMGERPSGAVVRGVLLEGRTLAVSKAKKIDFLKKFSLSKRAATTGKMPVSLCQHYTCRWYRHRGVFYIRILILLASSDRLELVLVILNLTVNKMMQQCTTI